MKTPRKEKQFLPSLLILLLILVVLLCACVRMSTGEDRGWEESTVPSESETAEQNDIGEAEPVREENGIRISEVMASNKSTLADRNGQFGDWLELFNAGNQPVQLEGYQLRCGKGEWTFPQRSMQPGEYLVVFCDKSDSGDGEELHADFAISAEGEKIRLFSADGILADLFSSVAMEEDVSACREEADQAEFSIWPTPGYENTESGYEAFQRSRAETDLNLVINEVVVYNEWTAPTDGSNYDWVELWNPTDQALNLGDYFLSDGGKNSVSFRLPEQELDSGGYVLINCSKEQSSELIAPFGLNSVKDELYLTRKDGTLCDYVCLRGVPYGGSYGRMSGEGFFYFDKPSPLKANTGGKRFTGEKPRLEGTDGVFNGVTEVIAEISGVGTVRYTLDGSEPNDSSPIYSEPIRMQATGVIRSASFAENHLRSEILNLSYIINEDHSLPVVSLVCDGEAMFSDRGVYNSPNRDLEIPAAVMFYEEDGGFREECGVKLHGATSKFIQEKKSLKLNFRNHYSGILNYDLFHNGVTAFSSILLRTAQEGNSSSYMRDALMHDIAKECFPELPSQDHRYAVLYINGEYWGLYNIREAHSTDHYANHYGYSAESVTQWQGKWDKHSRIREVYDFAITHSLSSQKNYEQVAEYLNTDSVIAWLILQYYSGNTDFNSPNMRFYWSEEDRQLRYALADLDLGFFTEGYLPGLLNHGYYAYNKLAGALMKNEGFRKEFCIRLNEVLSGALADEAFLNRIDSFAKEIEPEIAREKERWGGKTADWERQVEEIRQFITKKNGHARKLVRLLADNGAFHVNEVKEYLGEFMH